MDLLSKVRPILLAVLYIALCAVMLSPSTSLVGPGFFFILFLISLLLGGFLIVLQVDKDTGDDGHAIVMLSGEVIPAVEETAEQKQEDQKTNLLVGRGKIFFFLLSIFILIFWFKLTHYAIPKEWWDKGYSLLIYMYAYGEWGKDITHAQMNFGYGDYLQMSGNLGKARFDLMYISRPSLLSLPYTLFILYVLKGRSLFDSDYYK